MLLTIIFVCGLIALCTLYFRSQEISQPTPPPAHQYAPPHVETAAPAASPDDPFYVDWKFNTAIVGVTHRNSDGRSRQTLIASCRVGENIQLIPDPSNPYDENAIIVCRMNGNLLGFIRRELAEQMKMTDDMSKMVAQVEALTGGTSSQPTRGIVIRLARSRNAARQTAREQLRHFRDSELRYETSCRVEWSTTKPAYF